MRHGRGEAGRRLAPRRPLPPRRRRSDRGLERGEALADGLGGADDGRAVVVVEVTPRGGHGVAMIKVKAPTGLRLGLRHHLESRGRFARHPAPNLFFASNGPNTIHFGVESVQYTHIWDLIWQFELAEAQFIG